MISDAVSTEPRDQWQMVLLHAGILQPIQRQYRTKGRLEDTSSIFPPVLCWGQTSYQLLILAAIYIIHLRLCFWPDLNWLIFLNIQSQMWQNPISAPHAEPILIWNYIIIFICLSCILAIPVLALENLMSIIILLPESLWFDLIICEIYLAILIYAPEENSWLAFFIIFLLSLMHEFLTTNLVRRHLVVNPSVSQKGYPQLEDKLKPFWYKESWLESMSTSSSKSLFLPGFYQSRMVRNKAQRYGAAWYPLIHVGEWIPSSFSHPIGPGDAVGATVKQRGQVFPK